MGTFFSDVKKNKWLLLMAMPATLYIILFSYIPMFGIIIAFKDYKFGKGVFGSKWCGLKNFEFIFESGDAFVMIRNTILYNLVFIFLGTFLAVILAILFDALGKNKLNRFNQTVVIMPHFLSMVIISYFVYGFLSMEKGLINQFLNIIGMDSVDWYSEPKYWPVILVIVNLWSTLGWESIIYYSNIKGIDTEYYEAARVDGATWIQQVKNITFPLLKPTMIVMIIMSLGRIFASNLDLFYLIPRNSGPLYPVTMTVDTYVYNGLMKSSNMGMTSAVSVVQSVVGFVLVISVNQIIKKWSPEDVMF